MKAWREGASDKEARAQQTQEESVVAADVAVVARWHRERRAKDSESEEAFRC